MRRKRSKNKNKKIKMSRKRLLDNSDKKKQTYQKNNK